MIYRLGNQLVELRGKNHYIAPSAAVIGSVVIEEGVSIWFNVVIRGDGDQIIIGENSNIQDGAVLHVDPGFPLTIGKGVSVGHKAVLHGCTIGDNTLIGINAVVLNGAQIGSHCIIGAGALVTEGMVVPDGSLVLGIPAKIKSALCEERKLSLTWTADHYVENGLRYRQQLKPEKR